MKIDRFKRVQEKRLRFDSLEPIVQKMIVMEWAVAVEMTNAEQNAAQLALDKSQFRHLLFAPHEKTECGYIVRGLFRPDRIELYGPDIDVMIKLIERAVEDGVTEEEKPRPNHLNLTEWKTTYDFSEYRADGEPIGAGDTNTRAVYQVPVRRHREATGTHGYVTIPEPTYQNLFDLILDEIHHVHFPPTTT